MNPQRNHFLYVAQYYGVQGEFAYKAYDHINLTYFDNQLPDNTYITWELLAYGRAVGCVSATTFTTHGPWMRLHPVCWKREKRHGRAFTYDVVLHEAIHIKNRIDGYIGRESHNCQPWVDEVNRLAPLLGFPNIQATRKKSVRVDGTVVKRCLGNIKYKELITFPHPLRRKFQPDFYQEDIVPFDP